jgi:hypothetical protein
MEVISLASLQHFDRDALFQVGHGTDPVPAILAVDHGLIGEARFKIEVVFPALGAIKLYFHVLPPKAPFVSRPARLDRAQS